MDNSREPITASAEVDMSAEQYETILRNIHDAVYTLDADGRITWVNDVAFEEFDTGYSREDLIGAPVTKILSEEDITKCVEIISDLLYSDDRDSGRCEVVIQTSHGEEIPCDLHLALLPLDDGEFTGTLGVLRDITDRKRREQGRMVLNRVLRHNLRNQLNVIKGHAETLEHGNDAESAPHIQSINDTVADLVQLSEKARRVDEILTDDDRSTEPIEATELVENRCNKLRTRVPDVELSVETPSSVWVRADDRLMIAIDNLLENAVEHSDRSVPTIDVSITATGTSDDWVEIRVADDGPEIPAAEIESVTGGVETSLDHASGLGLWCVKWLVDRYGGDVAFEDNPPRGNIVCIRLLQADQPR